MLLFFGKLLTFFSLFIVKKYFKEPISKIINKERKIETELVTTTKIRKKVEHLLKEAETSNSSRKEARNYKNAQRKAEEEARNLISEAKREKIEKYI